MLDNNFQSRIYLFIYLINLFPQSDDKSHDHDFMTQFYKNHRFQATTDHSDISCVFCKSVSLAREGEVVEGNNV